MSAYHLQFLDDYRNGKADEYKPAKKVRRQGRSVGAVASYRVLRL